MEVCLNIASHRIYFVKTNCGHLSCEFCVSKWANKYGGHGCKFCHPNIKPISPTVFIPFSFRVRSIEKNLDDLVEVGIHYVGKALGIISNSGHH